MMQSGRLNGKLKLILGALLMASAMTMTAWSALAHASTAVDMRDLSQYGHDPMAEILVNAMKNTPSQFFPEGVSFSTDGPGRSRDWSSERRRMKVRKNTVYGVELSSEPQTLRNGSISFPLIAFIHTNAQGHFFRKMTATLGGAPLSVQSVQVQGDIPLADTHFNIEVGLIQRKAVLTDAEHGITKVYPLGVGSFDFGVRDESRGRVDLMTPTFTNATLRRVSPRGTIEATGNPSYYAKMPFLALHRFSQSIRHSGIAFHILQHPNENPARPLIGRSTRLHQADYNYLIRGFDSHGCMRVREKDLYELFSIVKGQSEDRIRVDVKISLDDTEEHAYPEHPYPLDNTRYQRVKNFGTEADPRPGLDHHGLTETEIVQGTPPIERVTPVERQRAELEELLNYDGGETGDELPEGLEEALG